MALTLQARGIPYAIPEARGGTLLLVPAEFAERAKHELWLFETENRRATVAPVAPAYQESAWGVAGYVVSFIAPHTLTSRPLVVAPDDVLHVHNLGDRDPVDVAMDGVPHGRLEPGSEIEIRFRENLGRLAQIEGQSFYRRIREKFGHFVQ